MKLAATTLTGVLAVCLFQLSLGQPVPLPANAPKKNRLEERDRLIREAERLLRANDFRGVIAARKKALAIEREVLGPQSDQVLISLKQLAIYSIFASESSADFVTARQARGEVLASSLKRFGHKDWRVTDARIALADLDILEKLNRADRDRFLMADHWAHQATGLIYRQGKPAEGLELARKSLKVQLRTLGEDHPTTALTLGYVATALQYLGKFEEAREYQEKVLRIRLKILGERHPETALAFNNLGDFCQSVGELAKARSYYQKSLEVRLEVLEKDNSSTAFSYHNLGSLLLELGEYPEARRLLEKALHIRGNIPRKDDLDVAQSYNALGLLKQYQRLYAGSRADYERALEIYRDYERRHKTILGVMAGTLNNVGTLLFYQRDYEGAQDYFEKGLARRRKILSPDHPDIAESLNNLGEVLYARSRLPEALERLEEALALYKQKLGPQHSRVALTLNNLGSVLKKQGNYAAARQRFQAALAIRIKAPVPSDDETAKVLDNLAFLELADGQREAARDYARRELALRLRLDRDRVGALSEAEGLQYIRESVSGPDLLLSVLRTDKVPDARMAYEAVWEMRAMATRALLSRRALVGDLPEAQPLWQELRDVRGRLSRLAWAGLAPEQTSRLLRQLTSQKEELQRRLAEVSDRYRQRTVAAAPFPRLAACLPPTAAMVDLLRCQVFATDKKAPGGVKTTVEYEAFVLRKAEGGPGYHLAWIHLGEAEPIDRAIRAWRAQLTGRKKADTAAEAPEHCLRRLVWAPLEKHLPGCTSVILVPDSALTAVPWAALPGKRAGSYLLEDYALATAAFGQQLHELLTLPALTGKKALVVGGVRYDAASTPPGEPSTVASRSPVREAGQRNTWPYLKGTRKEAEHIASLRSGAVTLLEGDAATEAALRKHMPAARYVHLATHGFFAAPKFHSALAHETRIAPLRQPGRPTATEPSDVLESNPLLLSGVVLAGANLPQKLGADGVPQGDDGILTAEEVAELDLHRTELVVLSACETGLGEVAGGEGVFGLQRAFHLAGARTVVASLWQVDDRATQRLMELFYENLWARKLPHLEALRRAQLTLLRGVGPAGEKRGLDLENIEPGKGTQSQASAHPRFWAAWVLSGDPGDLSGVRFEPSSK
jgi:CHAT domain-containing protein/Tfp pilus assembly protein PilF